MRREDRLKRNRSGFQPRLVELRYTLERRLIASGKNLSIALHFSREKQNLRCVSPRCLRAANVTGYQIVAIYCIALQTLLPLRGDFDSEKVLK